MTTLEAAALVSTVFVGFGAVVGGAVRSLWRLARFIDRLESRVDDLEKRFRIIEGRTASARNARR